MTDEQIIQSLPPGLQGDLKEFGPLEKKSSKEMHRFMLNMREKYELAPWHAFTLLMKRAAHAANDLGKGVSRDGAWCHTLSQNDSDFTTNLDPRTSWVRMTLKSIKTDGTQIGESEVAVQPSTGRIWLLLSESLQKAVNGVISIRSTNSSNYKAFCGQISRSHLIEEAQRAIYYKQTEIEIERKVRAVGKRKNSVMSVAVAEESQAAQDPIPPLASLPEQQGALTKMQKATLLIVFEMGAAKARELGMHSTIARWRTELAPIIGPEVHHVND